MIFPPLRLVKWLAELLDLRFVLRFILGVLLLAVVFVLVAHLLGTTPDRLLRADREALSRAVRFFRFHFHQPQEINHV